jgi:hypothetical protein
MYVTRVLRPGALITDGHVQAPVLTRDVTHQSGRLGFFDCQAQTRA